MSTVYASQHNEMTPAGAKGKRNKKKIIVVSAVVGTFLIPAAAWAAVSIFGFGTFDAAAATTQNLTVDNATAKLTGSLTPGNTVGAKADVKNPNDFPVTVTGVVLRNSTLAVTAKSPATAADQTSCEQTVHAVGTSGTYPGDAAGSGTVQAIATNVTIPAGQTRTVVIPAAVKQDASGTALCGVHADFAVVAQTAS